MIRKISVKPFLSLLCVLSKLLFCSILLLPALRRDVFVPKNKLRAGVSHNHPLVVQSNMSGLGFFPQRAQTTNLSWLQVQLRSHRVVTVTGPKCPTFPQLGRLLELIPTRDINLEFAASRSPLLVHRWNMWLTKGVGELRIIAFPYYSLFFLLAV